MHHTCIIHYHYPLSIITHICFGVFTAVASSSLRDCMICHAQQASLKQQACSSDDLLLKAWSHDVHCLGGCLIGALQVQVGVQN